METLMRTFNLFVLSLLLVTQSTSTQASDLNGAWTIDTGSCAQVFTKKNNKIAFAQDADLNAGGLIVQGKQITGTMQKCTVKSVHDDGSNKKVIAACSDGVMVSDVTFDVKFSGENNMTLSSKEPVPVEMRYVRCPL
jgi:filamentous hemagglutinin family protein